MAASHLGQSDSYEIVGWYVNDGRRRHDFDDEQEARAFFADHPNAPFLGEWREVVRDGRFGPIRSRYGSVLEDREKEESRHA